MRCILPGALFLGLAVLGGTALALDSDVDLVVENWGTEYFPVLDSVEYRQTWTGVMGVGGHDTWTWDRVGFRVLNQVGPTPGTAPQLIGYGVTYGNLTIENEYGAMRAFAIAVEDPRKRYEGYYGRLAGVSPDGSPFEGTLKFAEDADGNLRGEVDVVVNGGTPQEQEEVYFQPVAIKGCQTSGQTVEYFSTQPLAVYDNMLLAGNATGFMTGPVQLEMDAIRLGATPNPLLPREWSFMQPADGWAVGEATVPFPDISQVRFDEGAVWLGIQQASHVEPPVDTYAGMYLSHPQNRENHTPAFTIKGNYSFLTGLFQGDTEHLYNWPGDLDGDRYVGSHDLDIVRGNWLADTLAGEYLRGDCSRDGRVNSVDLDILRAHWGGPWITPVPEPGLLAIIAALSGMFIGRRPRRRS